MRASTYIPQRCCPIHETITVFFPRSSSPPDLSAFRRELTRTLDAQKCNLRIDLNEVETLSSPLLATLIAILRDARERGSSVLLRTGRRRILDTLRITALDKVFTVENIERATPHKGRYVRHLVA